MNNEDDISLTEGLKTMHLKISAVKATQVLMEEGLVGIFERIDSKGDVKSYKKFVGEGLKYGFNKVNYHNEQTSLRFYSYNFTDLMIRVKLIG